MKFKGKLVLISPKQKAGLHKIVNFISGLQSGPRALFACKL